MRLIDADALFLPDKKSDEVYIIGGRSGKMVALAMELLKKKVADAPAIEAEPLRHGYWEKRGQEIYCSECGEESGYTWAGASRYSNFCPSCEAKLDKEE